MNPQVLIIEDDKALAESLRALCQQENYDVVLTATAEEGLAQVATRPFDVVLTDLQLRASGLTGLQVIETLRQRDARLPVIMMTGHGTTAIAIEATKQGAFDYILKSGDQRFLLDLLALLQSAIASRRRMHEQVTLPGEETAAETTNAIPLVGHSRVMQKVGIEIGRVAPESMTVLIRGETGTGKELVARAIYQHGPRANRPFIVVNCAAIPPTLLESELFGYEKGAFTGAEMRRVGRFEQAHEGTIFLDEIGDLEPATQAKLLRVLQENTIQRLGGQAEIPVDARVLAATHQPLEEMLRQHTFREDLYYRLNVAVIHLPALRDRREDIPLLVGHFLKKHGPNTGAPPAGIDEPAIRLLLQQDWPGNVRQLENVLRKALLRARGFTIAEEHIRAALTAAPAPPPAGEQSLAAYIAALLERADDGALENLQQELTKAVERELYAQAIARTGGNQRQAAKLLGVSRPTMRDKLLEYGLHPGHPPPPAGPART